MLGAEYKTGAQAEDIISQEYSESEIKYLFYFAKNINNGSCKCRI
jgi:hypothetical protein